MWFKVFFTKELYCKLISRKFLKWGKIYEITTLCIFKFAKIEKYSVKSIYCTYDLFVSYFHEIFCEKMAKLNSVSFLLMHDDVLLWFCGKNSVKLNINFTYGSFFLNLFDEKELLFHTEVSVLKSFTSYTWPKLFREINYDQPNNL